MKDESKHKERYIRYAAELILAYKGGEPFHLYLKKYFRSHKKHGSKDRKNITSLCYHYFRLGSGILNPMTIEEKFELGDFLHPENGSSISEHLKLENARFDAGKIFPFNEYLSDLVDKPLFNLSFLQQPLLFVRIRPGFRSQVLHTLADHNIVFTQHGDDCLSFENTTQIEKLLKTDSEIVVQDYNSQRVTHFFDKAEFSKDLKIHIWDCCAGSGGKSILAADYFSLYQLTVTDKRKSILSNLEKRLARGEVKASKIRQADLSKPLTNLPGELFNLIIADVPCSGSGTWGRTPEQMHYFEETEITSFAQLQRSIVAHSLPRLKKNGYLLYLTCSVFAAENEENAKRIAKENDLQIVHQQYLKGYTMRADTLFGSLMRHGDH